ncbi:hypothetical protein BG75_04825 [Rickettsia endosymbiont of Proechinophthirus fluctus]|nr:hypothetical protein BG75_04825 [Rickettsia endosymbiont of Proechinophthirus fluctus]
MRICFIAIPIRLALAYSTNVIPKRFLNWQRAVEASTDSSSQSLSFHLLAGLNSIALTRVQTKPEASLRM